MTNILYKIVKWLTKNEIKDTFTWVNSIIY